MTLMKWIKMKSADQGDVGEKYGVRPGLQTQEEICPSLVGRPFFLHRKWIAKRREVRGTKRKRETWKRVWLESMGMFLINRSLQLTLCLCSLVYHVSRPSADLPFCCLFKIPNANLSGKQMMSAEWRNGCQKQCERASDMTGPQASRQHPHFF